VSDRLAAAFAAVDEVNARDPRVVASERCDAPADLLYGQRMSARLARFAPDASEALRLAVRAQHIGRSDVPRGAYPEGRAGYRRWRSDLAARHAAAAAAIAERVGYDPAVVARVESIVGKRGRERDPEVQILEDVACLVFLEHYLPEFAARHERAKVVDVVTKTWRKMSTAAHAEALALPLGPAERAIVEDALAGPVTTGPRGGAPEAGDER
jgi:hypothetical protein